MFLEFSTRFLIAASSSIHTDMTVTCESLVFSVTRRVLSVLVVHTV